MDIVEFLRARLDEDEQEARGEGADAMIGHRWKHLPETDYNAIQHATLARCRRVLREVGAKRAIIDEIESRDDFSPGMWGMAKLPARTLLALASVYADHPDHDQDWV